MRLRTQHSLHFCLLFSVFLSACNEPTGQSNSHNEIPVPTLKEVTAEAGLSDFKHDNGARGKMYFPEQMGSGGGFIDYNGDTWHDILLVGGGTLEGDSESIAALRLYKNNTDGTFSEVTEEAGLAGINAYGKGISAADYDNDGDEDFYFTTLHENYLFRNDGGTFSNVSEEVGLADQSAWSSSSLFFDADRDGDLDLYVANYAAWSPEADIFCSIQGVVIINTLGATNLEESYGQKVYCAPNEYEGLSSRFYRNNGDGTFTEETEEAGFLAAPGKSLGVASFDYNQDGWPDVMVANDAEADMLFKNKGDGTFEEIGERSGVAYDEMGYSRAGMGIDTGVVDESGNETIFVGNFSSETIGVYKYIGNDQFEDRAASSRIGQPSYLTLTFGLTLFDIEYDGDLDLMAANGHVWAVRPSLDGSTYRQKSQLFVNTGNGIFTQPTPVPGAALDQLMVARSISYADFDKDGDLDLLITENNGPAHLWQNELTDANYLRVRLQGKESNREGIGAQITAVTRNGRMHRRIRTGSSYLSQSEKVASFGLNNRTKVDSLIIQWPSGEMDVLLDVEGNQEITVIEGKTK